MNVITKEKFEQLAGLRKLTPATTNVVNTIFVKSEIADFTDENECEDCNTCPDYDACWSDEELDWYESNGDYYPDEDKCTCDLCTCGDETTEENVDEDVEIMEYIFDNGDWETVKEFIYEVVSEDNLISSNKISQFISDYFDEYVTPASIAAIKASYSRLNK